MKQKLTIKTQPRCFSTFNSPIGKIYLICSVKGLSEVTFDKPADFKESKTFSPIMNKVKKQMKEYFSGKRKSWDIPLDWGDTNGFYKRVRNNCAKIGYGKTVSYGELAKRSKSPRAARAVGTAMATNPLSIVVPCHRVVKSGGALGKYGGGVERKEWLQKLEASN